MCLALLLVFRVLRRIGVSGLAVFVGLRGIACISAIWNTCIGSSVAVVLLVSMGQ